MATQTQPEAEEAQVTELDAQAGEERGLITIQPVSSTSVNHHVISGMAALARMEEDDFQNTMAIIERGQQRIREFQQRVMNKGEDYGTVASIKRPFLHLPGAEKLLLLYGLAARQESTRLVGQRARVKMGEIEQETGEWLSPPLAFITKTFIHVGDFEGPIVAMGEGEANAWEEKYRYRTAQPACPKCGRKGLVKGREESRLKGKWWCPRDKGGCNSTFEPADPNIEKPGQVENNDPFSLAETLLQMSAKRSFVAAVRRATGTSGLFTQDEDSPSVREQAKDAGGSGDEEETEQQAQQQTRPVTEKAAEETEVERGGAATKPTQEQLLRLAAISREKDLGPDKVAAVAERLKLGTPALGDSEDRKERGAALATWLMANLDADGMGKLIHAIDTGDLGEEPPAPAKKRTSSKKAADG